MAFVQIPSMRSDNPDAVDPGVDVDHAIKGFVYRDRQAVILRLPEPFVDDYIKKAGLARDRVYAVVQIDEKTNSLRVTLKGPRRPDGAFKVSSKGREIWSKGLFVSGMFDSLVDGDRAYFDMIAWDHSTADFSLDPHFLEK